MLNLTKQQQTVIAVVLLLLLLGWTVKAWRAAHPRPPAAAAPGTP
jgi:predicted metal-binding membrane protein